MKERWVKFRKWEKGGIGPSGTPVWRYSDKEHDGTVITFLTDRDVDAPVLGVVVERGSGKFYATPLDQMREIE